MKTIALITLLACGVLWFAIKPTNDLVARYVGAQQALAGVDPYSDAATDAIQRGYYGRPARPDEDQQRFAYPGYSLFVFAPLAPLPIRVALVVSQGIQLALMLIALRRLGVTSLAAAGILIALKEPLVSLLIGNVSLWVAAWIGFALVELQRGREGRAGVYMAVAAIQPTLAVPIALLMLVNRRRGLTTYLASMTVLVGASCILWGFWIPDWLAQVRAYGGYVSYLVWLPAILPPVVIVGALAGVRAWLINDPLPRYAHSLVATVSLAPLTGLYHLTLFALVKLPVWAWIVPGVIVWGMSPLPFEIRRFEPLLWAGVVVIYHWLRERVPIFRPQPA